MALPATDVGALGIGEAAVVALVVAVVGVAAEPLALVAVEAAVLDDDVEALALVAVGTAVLVDEVEPQAANTTASSAMPSSANLDRTTVGMFMPSPFFVMRLPTWPTIAEPETACRDGRMSLATSPRPRYARRLPETN